MLINWQLYTDSARSRLEWPICNEVLVDCWSHNTFPISIDKLIVNKRETCRSFLWYKLPDIGYILVYIDYNMVVLCFRLGYSIPMFTGFTIIFLSTMGKMSINFNFLIETLYLFLALKITSLPSYRIIQQQWQLQYLWDLQYLDSCQKSIDQKPQPEPEPYL